MKLSKINPLLIAIILVLASVALNVLLIQNNRDYKNRVAALMESTDQGEAKIIERYIRDSVEHVVIREVEVRTEAEKSQAVGEGYLDTLARAMDVAVKRIEEATKVNAKLIAQNLALRKESDSGKYIYRDRWLSLAYNADSNTVDLDYDVSLNVAKHWDRKWFLGQKQHYIDISADDPRVRINSVKRFTVKEAKQKKFGIGLQLGYVYTPFNNKWQPALGIGVNYNLLEF